MASVAIAESKGAAKEALVTSISEQIAEYASSFQFENFFMVYQSI